VIRKYVLALSLLALPIGTVVATGSAANAAVRPLTAVTFTGSVTCSITGSITATPPLLLSTPQTTTIALTATATKCKGAKGVLKQDGVSLKSGKIAGKVVAQKEDCESLVSGVPNPVGTIKWKGKGGTITPTKFTLSDGSATFGSSSTTITFTSAQTGSFAGSGAASATVDQTESQLIKQCEGSGVATLAIASGSIS
jgi:hypothetical protein